MAKLINKYAENVMIRSVNRLINKYGHDCIVTQPREGMTTGVTPSKVLFGRYTIALNGGSLVINNNFRLRIRADSFPYPLRPFDRVTVNGVDLVALNARKISPDGATAIVWEVEAEGAEIPADGNQVATPSVLAPTNNQSFYPYVDVDESLYSAAFTSSAYQITSGDSSWVSSDWEIYDGAAPETATLVESVSGYTGGYTWTSGLVLENPVNYWVRVRHNGTDGIVSNWSALNLFSLGEISDVVPVDIVTPTIAFGDYPIVDGYIDMYYVRDEPGVGPAGQLIPPYKVYPPLTPFISQTGKEFSNHYWQVATDPAFSTLIYSDYSIEGGYDYDVGEVFDYNQLIMAEGAFPLDDDVQYYIRGRYVATDSTMSEYSPVVAFKILGEGDPPAGTIDTPTYAEGQFDDGTEYYRGYAPYRAVPDTSPTVYVYKFIPVVNEFNSPDGLEYDHMEWQVASDSAFTNLLLDVDSNGGYDTEANQGYGPWALVYEGGFFFYDETTYYVRMRFVATDGTVSPYSAVEEFKIPY